MKKPPTRPTSAASKRNEGGKRKKTGLKSFVVGSIEEPTIYENNLDEAPLKAVPAPPKSVPRQKSSGSKPRYDDIDKMERNENKDIEAPLRPVPTAPKINKRKKSSKLPSDLANNENLDKNGENEPP